MFEHFYDLHDAKVEYHLKEHIDILYTKVMTKNKTKNIKSYYYIKRIIFEKFEDTKGATRNRNVRFPSWLGIDTSIKSDGAKLVLWAQTCNSNINYNLDIVLYNFAKQYFYYVIL